MRAVRMLDQSIKRDFIEGWKEYMLSNDEIVHSNSARDFLKAYNVCEELVDSDEWEEWCNAIIDSGIEIIDETYGTQKDNNVALQEGYYAEPEEFIPPPPPQPAPPQPAPPPPRRQSTVPDTAPPTAETTSAGESISSEGVSSTLAPPLQDTLSSEVDSSHGETQVQAGHYSNNEV